MMLCLDVGNTHIYGGILQGDEFVARFRYPTNPGFTSDQLGLFIHNILMVRQIEREQLKDICICSVVPSMDYSVVAACIKYFDVQPLLVKHEMIDDMEFKVKSYSELGMDRVLNAVAAVHYYSNSNIFVVDCGTATTVCAISKGSKYLGGVIMPGVKTAMSSLSSCAAQLPSVDIVCTDTALGFDTKSNMQSGLYYSHVGAIKEVVLRIAGEVFQGEEYVVVATGGYCKIFANERIFDCVQQDLTLNGLKIVYNKYNKNINDGEI